LLAFLSAKRGKATPPTIYRALDFLTKSGLIHRIESLNAYAACAHAPAGPQHVFFTCERCGNVAEVESRDAGVAVEQDLDFVVL
jgi:Fur family transcriptional regulator, zinc uptake regulator